VSYENIPNFSDGGMTATDIFEMPVAISVKLEQPQTGSQRNLANGFSLVDCSVASGLIAVGGHTPEETWNVKVCDMKSGVVKFTVPTGDIHSCKFSPSGFLLCVGEAKRVIIFNCKNGQTVSIGAKHVHTTAWSSDGSLVAWGGGDATLQIRNAKNFAADDGAVASLMCGCCYASMFSADGKWFGCGGGMPGMGYVHLYDATTFKKRVIINLSDPVVVFAFAPDGQSFLHGSVDQITLRDIHTQAILQQFGPTSGSLSTCSFNFNGRLVAFGTDTRMYEIRDVMSSAVVQSSPCGVGHGGGCMFANSGTVDIEHIDLNKLLCFTAAKVQIRNLNVGIVKQTFNEPEEIETIDFSPNGKYIMCGGKGTTIRSVFSGVAVTRTKYAGERYFATNRRCRCPLPKKFKSGLYPLLLKL
jgi:WD40 repeat protein